MFDQLWGLVWDYFLFISALIGLHCDEWRLICFSASFWYIQELNYFTPYNTLKTAFKITIQLNEHPSDSTTKLTLRTGLIALHCIYTFCIYTCQTYCIYLHNLDLYWKTWKSNIVNSYVIHQQAQIAILKKQHLKGLILKLILYLSFLKQTIPF